MTPASVAWRKTGTPRRRSSSLWPRPSPAAIRASCSRPICRPRSLACNAWKPPTRTSSGPSAGRSSGPGARSSGRTGASRGWKPTSQSGGNRKAARSSRLQFATKLLPTEKMEPLDLSPSFASSGSRRPTAPTRSEAIEAFPSWRKARRRRSTAKSASICQLSWSSPSGHRILVGDRIQCRTCWSSGSIRQSIISTPRWPARGNG